MNIFQKYCEQFKYYPEIELEIDLLEEKKDNSTVTYYWYLGELVAIESQSSSKYRILYTEKGRELFNRLALITLTNALKNLK